MLKTTQYVHVSKFPTNIAVWTLSHLVLIFSNETILTLFKHRTFTDSHKTHRNPKQNLKIKLGSLLISHLIENIGGMEETDV